MSTNNNDKPPAKKPMVQGHLGTWLQPSIITNKKTGKSYIKKVEAPKEGPTLVGDQHKCPNCNRTFLTAQALGNHTNHCQLTLSRNDDLQKKRKANNIFAIGPGKTKPGKF